MNKLNKMANAIGNIDDRYLLEALEYVPKQDLHKNIRLFAMAAASICLLIGLFLWEQKSINSTITVYAYASNEELKNKEPVLMHGRIDDSGQMQGHPLEFYVLGNAIQSIRFSCKNEWISFVDWTEQRGDYGRSKNFTVSYGEKEEEYYYLVVDWTPWNIIRKLTDNENIKISDLKQEEKEDIIVMEVTYLDGRVENTAIWICLEDNGEFKVSVETYKIAETDSFIFQPDSLPILPNTEMEEKQKNTEEWSQIDVTIEAYYDSINQKIVDYVQVEDSAPFIQEYEGYETEEILLFEVLVENSENKRYIVIGSKDDWLHCEVLNEGY